MTSFATLPQAYLWKDRISQGKLTANVLPGGNFEDPEGLAKAGWIDEGYQSEGTHSEFVVMPENASKKKFQRVLRLSGLPEDKTRGVDAMASYVDHPISAVRTPPVKVYEGELIRIAVQIDMPSPCVSGAGGVFVRDSIGGEALQFRTTAPVPGWQEVVLYRRVPADGELTVMLGYGGHQHAKFDNLRIQKDTYDPQAAPVATAPASAPPARRR